MKRRKFLGLVSGALGAPFLPAPAPAAAAGFGTARYSGAALHAAIYHAQSRAVFSVWGLAKTLNLPLPQAEALMVDLAKRGIVGPLESTTFGGRWASSKIMKSEAFALRRAARSGRSLTSSSPDPWPQPDLGRLLAHLRMICRFNGMALHPRCATPK